MKKMSFWLSAVLASCAVVGGFAHQAKAAVIISIDDVFVPAGTTAIVGVYASTTTNDVISGFNLPLDYNDDGFVDANHDGVGDLPAGFSLASPALRNAVYTNTGLDMPQPQITLLNVDAIPTGNQGDIQLTSTPTKLFDLAVNVAGTVPAGTRMPLEIEIPAGELASVFNIAGEDGLVVASPTALVPAAGSITVIAIPEPSAMFLLAIPLAARRRRLRR